MRDIKVHGLVNDRILYFRQPSLWRYLSIFLFCCFKPLAYISIVFTTKMLSCPGSLVVPMQMADLLLPTGSWMILAYETIVIPFGFVVFISRWTEFRIFFFFFFSCTISHTLCFHWNSNVSFLLSNRSITLPLICEHIWWSKAVWSAQSIFVLQFFQYKMFFGFYCETDLESHFFLLCYSIFVYMLDIFLAHLPWWHLEHRIFFSSRKIYFPVLFVILHFRFSIYHKIMRAY